MVIPIVEGGFGEGKRCMLVKQISDIHQMDVGDINELIRNNISEFDEGIDILDLKNSTVNNGSLLEVGYTKQSIANSNNIYLLSEQGYMALVGLMRNEKATEIRKKIRREYFTMKEIIREQQIASYMISDPIERAEKWIEEEKKRKELELLSRQKDEVIQIQAPKVEQYEQFIHSKNSEKWDVVAMNLGIGKNKLLEFLREKKILKEEIYYKDNGKRYTGSSHNTPFGKYAKYFEVKFKPISNGDKVVVTLVKPRGQVWLGKIIKRHYQGELETL